MSYIEEWAEAYEQETGRKPAEPLMEAIRHIEKVGAMLREQGRKDVQSCENPRSARVFVDLAQYAFHNDLDGETAQAIGDLWWTEYMHGYQEGGAE